MSPDLGNAKDTAVFARNLKIPMAVATKQRISDHEVRIGPIIGDVEGKDVIVLDDEIARGTTTMELLQRLREDKAASIRIACTHGLFAAGAAQRLSDQPDVVEIVCTNTVPIPAETRGTKLTVLSIARPFAEAIRRIHDGRNPSARCFTPDRSTWRRPRPALGVQRILELLAGRNRGCLDGLMTISSPVCGLRPLAAGARGDDEDAEAGQADFFSRLSVAAIKSNTPSTALAEVFLSSPVCSDSFWMRSFLFTATAPLRDSLRHADFMASWRPSNRKTQDFSGKKAGKKAPTG